MARPPKGIFKRGSSWYVRLREHGRDRWVSLGSDYDEACRKLRRVRTSETSTSRSTVAEAAEQWLATYVRTARNPKGVQLTEARVRKYLVAELGWKLVARVTTDDLRSYRLWLEKQPIARQTVAHILSDARCLFTWSEDTGLISKSPVPRKLLPRIPERAPDRLNDEEIALLVALPEPHGFVVRFGLSTGLRWGELCRAQTRDIENGMLVVAGTKSGKVRRVPLTGDLKAELARRVGKLVPFSVTSSGAFNRIVRRESGVNRFHVHQLRHTFGCRWLERGGSLAALQEILGHSTIVTTQRYARLSDDLIRQEAERLEALSQKR
jgi:integrase